MRIDLLNEYKSVHFKMEKNAHSSFRIKCFQHNISMQDAIQEFVDRFVADDPKAVKIVENFIMRKVKQSIADMTKEIKDKDNSRRIREQDQETLYNMINGDNESSEDSES